LSSVISRNFSDTNDIIQSDFDCNLKARYSE